MFHLRLSHLSTNLGKAVSGAWQFIKAIFNNNSWPREVKFPPGVKLAPKGQICNLGGLLPPSFTPSEYCLMFRRIEWRTEASF
jgi:hypothetical protein